VLCCAHIYEQFLQLTVGLGLKGMEKVQVTRLRRTLASSP